MFSAKHLSQLASQEITIAQGFPSTMTKSLFKRRVMNNKKAQRKQQAQEQEK